MTGFSVNLSSEEKLEKATTKPKDTQPKQRRPGDNRPVKKSNAEPKTLDV